MCWSPKMCTLRGGKGASMVKCELKCTFHRFILALALNFFSCVFFLPLFLSYFILSWRHTLTKYWKLILLCFLFDAIKTTRYCIDSITHYTFRLKFVHSFVFFSQDERSITHTQFANWFICTQTQFARIFRMICLHKLLKRNFRHKI